MIPRSNSLWTQHQCATETTGQKPDSRHRVWSYSFSNWSHQFKLIYSQVFFFHFQWKAMTSTWRSIMQRNVIKLFKQISLTRRLQQSKSDNGDNCWIYWVKQPSAVVNMEFSCLNEHLVPRYKLPNWHETAAQRYSTQVKVLSNHLVPLFFLSQPSFNHEWTIISGNGSASQRKPGAA